MNLDRMDRILSWGILAMVLSTINAYFIETTNWYIVTHESPLLARYAVGFTTTFLELGMLYMLVKLVSLLWMTYKKRMEGMG